MIVFILASLVVVLGVVVALLLGRTAGASVAMSPATSTAGGRPLPSGPVGAADVDALRFDTVLRGYRPEQVDAALARLADEIADRDALIAQLYDAEPRHAGGFGPVE